jgi:carbonic anhydrase
MDDTLAKLFNSNEQWSKAVEAAEPGFFENSAKGQSPKILWLGCSDSRVPESVITASPPGYIFVHRNIANQIHPDDDSALAVLTYAIGHMPKIEDIVVVGHTNCGGAKAALEAVTNPSAPEGEPVLVRWLTPLLELAKNLVGGGGPAPPGTLTKLIEESVGVQVNNVANSEPVKKAWAKGRKVKVHGLIYELETGRLRDLHVTRHS